MLKKQARLKSEKAERAKAAALEAEKKAAEEAAAKRASETAPNVGKDSKEAPGLSSSTFDVKKGINSSGFCLIFSQVRIHYLLSELILMLYWLLFGSKKHN